MPASRGWGHRTEPGLGFSAFPLESSRPWVEPGAVLPAPRQALGSVLGFSVGCEGPSRSCISWEPAAASDFGAQSPATLSCGSQTFPPGGFPRRSWGRLRGCVAPWKQPGAVGFFSGVVAKARGESARIKSRWTEQTPAGCCAGAVPLHQPISISALPAWLLRAINQSRQQLLTHNELWDHEAAASLLPGAPLRGGGWRGKGAAGQNGWEKGCLKGSLLHPCTFTCPKPKGFGRGGLGDEATLGTKPPWGRSPPEPAAGSSSPWCPPRSVCPSVLPPQGVISPTTSSWAARSSTPRTPRVTSSARTATSTSWGTAPCW